MDLFDYMRSNAMEKEAPLASRLRPRTLEEVVGQQHIIGKDKMLYRAIKADKLGSVIFYGPPGTGKTTLAIPPVRNLPRSMPLLPEKKIWKKWCRKPRMPWECTAGGPFCL